MTMRSLVIGLIGAAALALPAAAQSPAAQTVVAFHNAAQAEMTCTRKVYTAEQEDRIAAMVLAATNNAVLSGDELAWIYASRPFMAARASSMGCNEAQVVAARNFARERGFPPL